MTHKHYATLKYCTELLYNLLNNYKYDTICIYAVIDDDDSPLGYLYNINLDALIDSILNRACEFNSVREQLDSWYKNCDESVLPNINYSKNDILIKHLLQKFDTKTGLNFGDLSRYDIRRAIVDRIFHSFNTPVDYKSIDNACEDIKALLQGTITYTRLDDNNSELDKKALKNAKKAIKYLDSQIKASESYWS